MARRSDCPKTGHTILVVDDQEEVLLSVRRLLERDGHRVLTAEEGHAALEILHREEVHLLLVDFFMPRMTGEELIRRVREFDPHVQIILQTGYSGEKPPRQMLAELDIQGYHDKADGPERLLFWVDVGLKAHRTVQRLLERERLQSELVANVSHELRTPINIVSGYTELLLDGGGGAIPHEAVKMVERIAEASRNLGELVSNILAYARVEGGVNRVAEHEVAVPDVVQEITRLADVLLEERAVVFLVESPSEPSFLVTDPVKLKTILRNLITNAAKFTATGFIQLIVEQERGSIVFEVRDTGPGIPPGDLETIFEPFRQIDGSSTRAHGGVGLGLALSRKLARLLGGDLVVESTLGKGSLFRLVLPAPTYEGAIQAAQLRPPISDAARAAAQARQPA